MKQNRPIESLKHATLWWFLTWSYTWLHQAYFWQNIEQILQSSASQFITTLWNGYINLRIYNFVKNTLSENTKSLSQKQIQFFSALVSSFETFLVIYTIHKYGVSSKNPEQIALSMQLSTFFTLYAYDKIFLQNKFWKNK